MSSSYSAIHVLTRDKARAAGFSSSFEEDAKAALRAWGAFPGRASLVIVAEEGRMVAALSWAEPDAGSAPGDFRRQCELFAVAAAPAPGNAAIR